MYKLVGTKEGQIAKDFVKKNYGKILALSFGVLVIGSGFSMHANIIENRNTDKIINNASKTYSSDYSKTLETLLDVTIDDKDRDMVNTLCEYLQEIDEYEKVGMGVNEKFISIGHDVESIALGRLKSELAKSNDVREKDIKIYVGTYGTKYSVEKDDKSVTHSLKGDSGRLSDSIARLQGVTEDAAKKNDVNLKLYNNYVRDVIIDTIKFVNNKEDYKLPFEVGYDRGLWH